MFQEIIVDRRERIFLIGGVIAHLVETPYLAASVESQGCCFSLCLPHTVTNLKADQFGRTNRTIEGIWRRNLHHPQLSILCLPFTIHSPLHSRTAVFLFGP
ncbi:hypothetical protein UPYG_G00225760 [Umbra pygmaea]|uniref:Uncharacterized protein n=1 Tax=Umbra pygmaea TaxID=75934 RepID=A0ABD0WHA1_UMBPY